MKTAPFKKCKKWLINLLLGTAIASVVLSLASMAVVLDWLAMPLKVASDIRKADVIVVLSAGLLEKCDPNPVLLWREQMGADLWRQGLSRSGKIIVTGQYTDPHQVALEACRHWLADQLDIPPKALILENQATSTYENVRYTRPILARHGWESVLLVTDRAHMLRAVKTFEKQNVTVYPAVLEKLPYKGPSWKSAMRVSYLRRFLYEYGALLQYKCYGYI